MTGWDRFLGWVNPRRVEQLEEQVDEHNRRLVLANRKQAQLAARVRRLEAESELILRTQGSKGES